MEIIIQDESTGKRYMIKGHDLDWEIFKESKGKMVDGELVGKGNWTTCRNYPSRLEYAVGTVFHWFMADPNEDTKISTTTRKAVSDIRKAINAKAKEITLTVKEDR